METKTIKTFSELNAFLSANANLYTYDYTGGCESNCIHQTIDIDIDDPFNSLSYCGYLYTFDDQEQLNNFIIEESNNFDPTQGADDQYYDYNPSQLEAILFALSFASQETIKKAKQILLPKLDSFIQDEEQDEDMLTMYNSYKDSLTSSNYTEGLELTAMLNDMKQHL